MLYFRNTKIQAIDELLIEAKQFAYGLLRSWNMGRCQEDIIILYARDNNIVILLMQYFPVLHTVLSFVCVLTNFAHDYAVVVRAYQYHG